MRGVVAGSRSPHRYRVIVRRCDEKTTQNHRCRVAGAIQVRRLIVFRGQMFGRSFAISLGVRAQFAPGPCAFARRGATRENSARNALLRVFYMNSFSINHFRKKASSLHSPLAAWRRPRAAGAPWEARARAARGQTAGENLWWVGGGGAHTSCELPQAAGGGFSA